MVDDDWRVEEWRDQEDLVIDVYRGDERVFSQFLPEVSDRRRNDVIASVEEEAQAMLLWVEHVKKI